VVLKVAMEELRTPASLLYKGIKMAEQKPKKAVAPARKSTDARRLTAKNPTVVKKPAPYKPPVVPKVVKGKAGRPKKPQ